MHEHPMAGHGVDHRRLRIGSLTSHSLDHSPGEFVKAVQGSALARGRILDWFHIAMKFKAAENSVWGSKHVEPHERDRVRDWLRRAQWLVWDGKSRKAAARIKELDEELMVNPDHEDSTLWWNLRRLYFYIDNNESTLVNYGARYRKGLPISSTPRCAPSTTS